MMLKNKVAVIYGAGGAVGGAVARAFAREGARLFLTGRHRVPIEAVAKEVVSGGGPAETAEVDALDEQAVDRHLQSVIDKAGRVDVSFNAVGIPNTTLQGVPLAELDVEHDHRYRARVPTSQSLCSDEASRRVA
jgi:NAD(P)-dependent dehydrogenase (short-subunit alcohol dehydrogenase family)